MKNLRHAMRRLTTEPGSELYLGLVIFPEPNRGSAALAALKAFPGLELGEPISHRIPAFAQVPPGQDEAMLRGITALPDILGVDVVFAQLVAHSA